MNDEQLWQIKTAVAAIATCMVRAAQSSDPDFEERFLQQLSSAYSKLRDGEKENQDLLETLSWTRELITGFNMIDGQKDPFLPRPE